MGYQPHAIEDSGGGPTIQQRVDLGRQTDNIADGAIVPMPAGTSLATVPIPHALRGKQAADVARLQAAGYKETRYIYRAPDGSDVLAICRFDNEAGEKTFRPLHYLGKDSAGASMYDARAIASPRPLYNSDLVTGCDLGTVIMFVEGEKAADKAAQRFRDMVVTTWPGGAKSVDHADFRDAANREVVLWPDNDPDGREAMEKAAVRLVELGCYVSIVDVPSIYPPKYDLADDDPEGAVGDLAPEVLWKKARHIDKATAAAMKAAKRRAPALRRAKSGGVVANNEAARGFSAMTFLGQNGVRDYTGYGDWFDMLVASKNSFGEAGFLPAVKLSQEYGGSSEDEIRRKWDAIDERPEGEQLTIATFLAQAVAAGWVDPGGDNEGSGDGGGNGRSDPAAFVLEQSEEAGDVLWLDQHGKAHVSVKVPAEGGGTRTVHMRVGSKRHRGLTAARFRSAKKNKVLAADQEKRAMLLMDYAAREAGVVQTAALRAAEHDGCLYVDLGRADGKMVKVDASNWEIVDDAPVRFVRGSRAELPMPEKGGSLDLFRRHLNLSNRDVIRVIAFVIGALSPLPSFPILLVEGRQGTAKSTIGDMAVALGDPPHGIKAGRLTMPRGEQNLLVHASGVRIVFVDNLSDLSPTEADSLCRLATGGGTSARQHYTDDEEAQLNAVRPTIVTCIGTPTGRGDFLDRCVRVTALPIALRRTEEAVHSAFEADRPRMVGFVMDCLSAAIRNKPAVDALAEKGELQLARMADFALWVEGAAEMLGMEVGQFSAAILDEQAMMQAEAALGDPLGDALVHYFSADETRKVLTGFATEVLDELKNMLADPSTLPASNQLGGAFRRIEPGLNDLGLAVQITPPSGHARKTNYRVWPTDKFQKLGDKLPF